ncbi:hypothetical protein CBS9595_002025 [Malassezia furfur]|nr:hypothetical protein CBS9595_002025 [Malassezia furfur]
MPFASASRAAGRTMRSRWSQPPMYVGPPDTLSNLRPVVFGVGRSQSAPSSRTRPQGETHATSAHPYSLSEFSMPTSSVPHGTIAQYVHRLGNRLEAAQLQARLQSMWLDQFNQRFWSDNNARFQRAREEYEAASGAIVGEAPLEQVAPFYRAWLATNAGRLRNYNRALWAATARVVLAQTHYALLRYYTQLVARFAGIR